MPRLGVVTSIFVMVDDMIAETTEYCSHRRDLIYIYAFQT